MSRTRSISWTLCCAGPQWGSVQLQHCQRTAAGVSHTLRSRPSSPHSHMHHFIPPSLHHSISSASPCKSQSLFSCFPAGEGREPWMPPGVGPTGDHLQEPGPVSGKVFSHLYQLISRMYRRLLVLLGCSVCLSVLIIIIIIWIFACRLSDFLFPSKLVSFDSVVKVVARSSLGLIAVQRRAPHSLRSTSPFKRNPSLVVATSSSPARIRRKRAIVSQSISETVPKVTRAEQPNSWPKSNHDTTAAGHH